MRYEFKIGDVFGRLTIIGERERITRSGDSNTRTYVNTRCSCGTISKVILNTMVSGKKRSCGCLITEMYAAGNTGKTHGLTKTKEYRIWVGIKGRCNNKNSTMYYAYGAVGIKVCERWSTSFTNFLDDMGKAPTNKHSIDRYPNQKGNYEPGNCRWATTAEQCRNTKSNIVLEMDGVEAPLVDWANFFGLQRETIRYRINKGMTLKQAIFTQLKH